MAPCWNTPQGVEFVQTLCAGKSASDDRINNICKVFRDTAKVKRYIKARKKEENIYNGLQLSCRTKCNFSLNFEKSDPNIYVLYYLIRTTWLFNVSYILHQLFVLAKFSLQCYTKIYSFFSNDIPDA